MSGVKAIDFANSKKYAIVFMDVNMPIMNGLETTKQIREMHGSSKTSPYIVGMTGDNTPEAEEMCLQAGMNRVLFKPVTRKAIVTLLSEIKY